VSSGARLDLAATFDAAVAAGWDLRNDDMSEGLVDLLDTIKEPSTAGPPPTARRTLEA
jgi:hypothetical protein